MILILVVRLWSRDAFEKLRLLTDGVESKIGKTRRFRGIVGAAPKNTSVRLAKEKARLRHEGNRRWMLDEIDFCVRGQLSQRKR